MCQPHGVCILDEELRPATGAIVTLVPTSVREIGKQWGILPEVVHFPCFHGSHGRAHISSMPWSEYPSSPRRDGEEQGTQYVGGQIAENVLLKTLSQSIAKVQICSRNRR